MPHTASAQSPILSEVFALAATLAISVVVLLILRYFLPLRTTPAFYLVPIFLAIFLPAAIVLLVPIDLASSARTEDERTRGIWLPERLLLVSWRISYWLTFALTWYGGKRRLIHRIAKSNQDGAGSFSRYLPSIPTPDTASHMPSSCIRCAPMRNSTPSSWVPVS